MREKERIDSDKSLQGKDEVPRQKREKRRPTIKKLNKVKGSPIDSETITKGFLTLRDLTVGGMFMMRE